MTGRPWFRMYAEFATDPKVQSMSEAMQRRLLMLLCMQCSDILHTLEVEDVCFALRITEEELQKTKDLFVSKGFVDSDWNILNWDKRQCESDSSAERTRRYRERRAEHVDRHGDVTVTKCDALDKRRVEERREEKKRGNFSNPPPEVLLSTSDSSVNGNHKPVDTPSVKTLHVNGNGSPSPPPTAGAEEVKNALEGALKRMTRAHPLPGRLEDARQPFCDAIQGATDPMAAISVIEKHHLEASRSWLKFKSATGAWIPDLVQYFTDGYYLRDVEADVQASMRDLERKQSKPPGRVQQQPGSKLRSLMGKGS